MWWHGAFHVGRHSSLHPAQGARTHTSQSHSVASYLLTFLTFHWAGLWRSVREAYGDGVSETRASPSPCFATARQSRPRLTPPIERATEWVTEVSLSGSGAPCTPLSLSLSTRSWHGAHHSPRVSLTSSRVPPKAV